MFSRLASWMVRTWSIGRSVQTGTPRERRNTSTCGAMPFIAPLTMPTMETARPPGILGTGTLSFLGPSGPVKLHGCSLFSAADDPFCSHGNRRERRSAGWGRCRRHGIPLILEADGRAWKASVRGDRPAGPRDVALLELLATCCGAGLVGLRRGLGLVPQGQCCAFPTLRVHDNRRDDAPGWRKPADLLGRHSPDLAESHQDGRKPRLSLSRSRRIWQSCARELV